RFGDAADLVEEPRPAGDGSARGRRRRGGPGRDRQGRPAREQDGLPRRGDQEIHDPARRTHRGQRLSLGQAVGQAPPHQQGLLLRDRGSLRRLSHRRAIRPGISDSSRVRTRAGSVCTARPAPPRRQGCGGARSDPVAAARGRRKLWNDVVSHRSSMEAAAMAEDTDHTPSYVATGQEFTSYTNYIDDHNTSDAAAQSPLGPGWHRIVSLRLGVVVSCGMTSFPTDPRWRQPQWLKTPITLRATWPRARNSRATRTTSTTASSTMPTPSGPSNRDGTVSSPRGPVRGR